MSQNLIDQATAKIRQRLALPPLIRRAGQVNIVDEKTNRDAASLLKDIMAGHKRIDAEFDPWIKEKKEEVKEAQDAKKEYSDPLDAAEALVKQKRKDWEIAGREKAEADRKKEQERLDKIAEDERKRNLDMAQELREAGATEAADTLESAPVEKQTAPSIGKAAPIHGQTLKGHAKFDIEDKKAFVTAWLAGKVPEELVIVNEPELGKIVRNPQRRAEAEQYPGIKIWDDQSLAVRV